MPGIRLLELRGNCSLDAARQGKIDFWSQSLEQLFQAVERRQALNFLRALGRR
jgi:hypothetical protein